MKAIRPILYVVAFGLIAYGAYHGFTNLSIFTGADPDKPADGHLETMVFKAFLPVLVGVILFYILVRRMMKANLNRMSSTYGSDKAEKKS